MIVVTDIPTPEWALELQRLLNSFGGTPIAEIVVCDSEFTQDGGNLQVPVAFVFDALIAGKRHSMFFAEDKPPYPACPFKFDRRILFVTFTAAAELMTMLQLGWDMPQLILDLDIENLHLHNEESLRKQLRTQAAAANKRGELSPLSLLGVCAAFGVDIQSPAEKEHWRDIILEKHPYNIAIQYGILQYCGQDVTETVDLLGKMWRHIPSLRAAIYRGRCLPAFAKMRANGIHMNALLTIRFANNIEPIMRGLRDILIEAFPVFNDGGIDVAPNKFVDFLKQKGWYASWPKRQITAAAKKKNIQAVGSCRRDAETLELMSDVIPELAPLTTYLALRSQTKAGLRFPIGSDSRCRFNPWLFGSVTGRCQPSSRECPLVASSVWRHLLESVPGYALCEFDWSAQEFWIAAYLSKDPVMMQVVNSTDPYVAFGALAGFLPANATKDPTKSPYPLEEANRHAVIRDQFKAIALGTLYGKTYFKVAKELGISVAQAKAIFKEHRRLFKQYWHWINGVVGSAFLRRNIRTKFGWQRKIKSAKQRKGDLDKHGRPKKEKNSIKNHPMQSHGAEILRLAARYAHEAGIEIVATLHDAIFAMLRLETLERDISLVKECMYRASMVVVGAKIPVDEGITEYPNSYVPKKQAAQETWTLMLDLLAKCEANPQGNTGLDDIPAL